MLDNKKYTLKMRGCRTNAENFLMNFLMKQKQIYYQFLNVDFQLQLDHFGAWMRLKTKY